MVVLLLLRYYGIKLNNNIQTTTSKISSTKWNVEEVLNRVQGPPRCSLSSSYIFVSVILSSNQPSFVNQENNKRATKMKKMKKRKKRMKLVLIV